MLPEKPEDMEVSPVDGSPKRDSRKRKRDRGRGRSPQRYTKQPRNQTSNVGTVKRSTFSPANLSYTYVKSPYGKLANISGASYVSYGFGDPYARVAPGIMGILEDGFNIVGFNQIPTPSGSENVFAAFVNDLGFQIVARANDYGARIRNFATSTLGTTNIGYLNAIGSIYIRLRLLEALAALNGYNLPCSLISTNILNDAEQLTGRFTRLAGYPVPMKFYRLLDNFVGVFLAGQTNEDVPFFYGVGPRNTNFTNPTALAAYYAAIDLEFSALQVMQSTPPPNPNPDNANVGLDFANLTQAYSYLWGQPESLGPANLINDVQKTMMMFSRAMSYVDNTTPGAEVGWASPSSDNTVVRNIPLFIWGKSENVDSLWTTLFRPPVYYINNGDPVGTVASRGVFVSGLDDTAGVEVDYYLAIDGTFAPELNIGAGPKVIGTTQDSDVFDFPHKLIAVREVGSTDQVAIDGRSLPGWRRIYVPPTDLLNNTEYLYQDLFLTGEVGIHPNARR